MSTSFSSPVLSVTKDNAKISPALFEHIVENNRLGYSEQEIAALIQNRGNDFERLIRGYHGDKGFHGTRAINDFQRHWPTFFHRAEKDALLALYDFRNEKTGDCFPSEKKIAEKASYSPRQISRAKKGLIEKRIIHWIRRFNGSNVYQLDDASLAIAVVIGKLLDQHMMELEAIKREEMEGPSHGIDIMAMAIDRDALPIDKTSGPIDMVAIPSGHEGSLTSNRTSKSTSNSNSLPNQINTIPHSANGGYSFDEDEREDLISRLVAEGKWAEVIGVATGQALSTTSESVLTEYCSTSYEFDEALEEVLSSPKYQGLRDNANADALLDAAIKNSQRRYSMYQRSLNGDMRAGIEKCSALFEDGAIVKEYPYPSLCTSLWDALIRQSVIVTEFWSQNGRVWQTEDKYEIKNVAKWLAENRGEYKAELFKDCRYIGEELG